MIYVSAHDHPASAAIIWLKLPTILVSITEHLSLKGDLSLQVHHHLFCSIKNWAMLNAPTILIVCRVTFSFSLSFSVSFANSLVISAIEHWVLPVSLALVIFLQSQCRSPWCSSVFSCHLCVFLTSDEKLSSSPLLLMAFWSRWLWESTSLSDSAFKITTFLNVYWITHR